MRKPIILALSLMIVITLIVTTAYAWRGGGQGPYNSGCPYYSVDAEKAQKFYNETLQLRQRHMQTRGELMQLYAQQNPDWNLIAKKEQELAQIRVETQKKARELGIPYGCGRGGCNYHRGW